MHTHQGSSPSINGSCLIPDWLLISRDRTAQLYKCRERQGATHQVKGGNVVCIIEAAPGKGDVEVEAFARPFAKIINVPSPRVEAITPACQ